MHIFGVLTLSLFFLFAFGWRLFFRYWAYIFLVLLGTAALGISILAWFDGFTDAFYKLLVIAVIVFGFALYRLLTIFTPPPKSHPGGRWGNRSYTSRSWCSPPRRT